MQERQILLLRGSALSVYVAAVTQTLNISANPNNCTEGVGKVCWGWGYGWLRATASPPGRGRRRWWLELKIQWSTQLSLSPGEGRGWQLNQSPMASDWIEASRKFEGTWFGELPGWWTRGDVGRAVHPGKRPALPPYLALYISSVWLFLSHILLW